MSCILGLDVEDFFLWCCDGWQQWWGSKKDGSTVFSSSLIVYMDNLMVIHFIGSTGVVLNCGHAQITKYTDGGRN